MPVKIFGIGTRLILGLIAGIAAYAIISKAFNFWPWPNQKVIEAKAAVNVAEAVSAAATEAVNTVAESNVKESQLQTTVEAAMKEIDDVPSEASPLATRRAVIRAVCQLKEYKNDPQCQTKE